MPTTAPGRPLSFLAGIGDFFAGTADPFVCWIIGPAHCAEALATGDLPSQAYTNWVASQGIDTASNSAFSSGQVGAGVLLIGAGGLLGAAFSAADEAGAASEEVAVQAAKQAGAEDAGAGDVSPSSPTGQRGSPMDVPSDLWS
jgi:hypothetical protein